jgi:hypothetical protein
MGACRQVSSALAALASGTWTVQVDSPGGQSRWTVQVDSPGDSRRDESDYVHVASSGASAASDMWSALCRQTVGASLGVRPRARWSWPRELMSSFVNTF